MSSLLVVRSFASCRGCLCLLLGVVLCFLSHLLLLSCGSGCVSCCAWLRYLLCLDSLPNVHGFVCHCARARFSLCLAFFHCAWLSFHYVYCPMIRRIAFRQYHNKPWSQSRSNHGNCDGAACCTMITCYIPCTVACDNQRAAHVCTSKIHCMLDQQWCTFEVYDICI